MKNDEKRACIKRMLWAQRRVLEQFHAVDAFMGGMLWEGSLGMAVSAVMDDAVRSCCESTGLDYDSVIWFIYDNDFGERGLEAECGGRVSAIKSVDDFIDFEFGQQKDKA